MRDTALSRALLVGFGLFHAYRVLPFVPVSQARMGAGLLVVAVFWCLVASKPAVGPSSRRLYRMGLIWVVVSAAYLLPTVASGRPIYLVWVLTDLTLILLPLLLLYAGLRLPGFFDDRRGLLLFGLLLFAAAVLAAVVGDFGRGRFYPPSIALIAGVWLASMLERRPRHRVALFLANGVLLFLCLQSGGRAVTIAWVIAGLAAAYMVGHGRKVLVGGVLAVALLWALAAFGVASIDYGAWLEDSEFSSLRRIEAVSITGESQDVSMSRRLGEAGEVLGIIRDDGVVNLVLGRGHGATFRPVRNFSIANINADGLAHSIHIGPVLVLYRYGIVGLVFFVWLVVWSVGRVRAARWRIRKHRRVDAPSLFAMALLLYMAVFMVQNSSADPTFAYVLAGALWHWRVADRGNRETWTTPRERGVTPARSPV